MDHRGELIRKAKEAAATVGTRTLSRAEFTRLTGVSGNQIYRHFDGWRQLCEMAGLEPHKKNVKLDESQVFSAMRETFLKLGRITTRTSFDRKSTYSADVFKKRGMSWNVALTAFRNWVERNDPSFPYLDQLPNGALPPTVVNGSQVASSWRSQGGRLYGEFISFRGLLHAPVNEQGVVFLFGMVAHELGYVVEMVTTGFPDCEAKRRVSGGRWERVRVEFEYQSRNFRDHGHNPAGCDVIVCWEHNWPECRLEVLELKAALRSVSAT